MASALARNPFEEAAVDLDEYQRRAGGTNQLAKPFKAEIDPERELRRLLPLLGMAGEVGSLLAEVKKFLRDGNAHPLFSEHVGEELGDILWYLSTCATDFGHSLSALASDNLDKTRRRWVDPADELPPYRLLDDYFEPAEQLPRKFVAEIHDVEDADGRGHVEITINGENAGDHLRDNAYEDDGYRFHDVFHLAHAAVLGWSPVLRGKLMHHKRASDPSTMEFEDGGRAIVIDEAIVAYVWGYAREHRFLEDCETIDYTVLKTIEQLTSGLEVSQRQLFEWEEAILVGYRAFRTIREVGGGTIEGDLLQRSLTVVSSS